MPGSDKLKSQAERLRAEGLQHLNVIYHDRIFSSCLAFIFFFFFNLGRMYATTVGNMMRRGNEKRMCLVLKDMFFFLNRTASINQIEMGCLMKAHTDWR